MRTTTDTTNAITNTGNQAQPPMRAVIQNGYGSAEVIGVGLVDRPTPGPKQVLIEVWAGAVDQGTCHLMTGTPYLIRLAGYGLTKPKNPIVGLDVAGRVVAIGRDVTRFAVGDEIFGIAEGSLAEYATAAEDKLAIKPAGLSFEQAAAAAVSGITALQALTDVGRVEAGQHVLVIGASGGVGSYAVQLAKALDADVTAVASTRNLELVRSLGADHVVDYTTQKLTDTERRYDLILDIGGRNRVSRLRTMLTRSGTLVFVGGEGGNRVTGGIGRQLRAVLLSPFVSQRLKMFVSTEHHSFMERLTEYLDAGTVIPAIQGRFPIADAAAAIEQLAAGRASGKSVINIRDNETDRLA